MHESAFEIDDNIAIYDGYTDGTHWNGWACPWFTKETDAGGRYICVTGNSLGAIAEAAWNNVFH